MAVGRKERRGPIVSHATLLLSDSYRFGGVHLVEVNIH